MKYFLTELSAIYEIYIYTMGNTDYACTMVDILNHALSNGDNSKPPLLLHSRIIAREQKQHTQGIEFKTLMQLIPCGQKVSLILDDRMDVWPQDG